MAVLVAPRVLLFIVALCSFGASAQEIEGSGRISLLPGWRYTPNVFFADSADEAGHALTRPSFGGPQITGTFGYAASSSIEVVIELFAGYESLHLEASESVSSVSYGALAGFRGFLPLESWVLNAGLGIGPVLVYTTGGPTERGIERLTTGYSATAGVSYFLSPSISLTAELRYLLARGFVDGIGGINGGGLWGGVGVTFWMLSEPSRPGAVR